MMIRPAFKQIRNNMQTKRNQKKEKSLENTGVEDRYRQRVLHYAQGCHLSAPLFSLDEIIEQPTLLAPPPRVEPGSMVTTEDIVASTVPYLPAWPEMATRYNAPRLTLSQALSGSSDVVLTGQPGCGKTVTLAHLASRLARRDLEPGLPVETIPFFFHVADLDLPGKKEDPIFSIIDLVAEKAPARDLSHIPDFIRKAFSEGRALLLLDGTDELTPNGLKSAVEFIKAVKKGFPKTRVVTTASSEYFDGLISLNFIPLAVAAWSEEQRIKFLEKWGDLWTNYVAVEAWAQNTEHVDPILINGWLNSKNTNLTPMELTLMAWGAYAGDICGPKPCDAIETHLRRLSHDVAPREALEMLALQSTLCAEPLFEPRRAREWIKTFELPEATISDTSDIEEKVRNVEKIQPPPLGMLTKLADGGLLTHHRGKRMRFIHPVFSGYLAGKSLAKYKSESLFDQPPCINKNLALHFMAAFGDASPYVDKFLTALDRPLSRNLLTPARWLRDVPGQSVWRGKLMGKLVELIRQTGQPLGLRGQALCALIYSDDTSVAAALRKMMEEQDDDLLILASLGLGLVKDTKAVEQLTNLLDNQSLRVRRAACLALVSIGSTAAMDSVGSALLHGDDNLRRAAAEALSNHPSEGHAMLKEGAAMKDDLMVRSCCSFWSR